MRMLEIFYEKKDFFLLKEMEKIAPKEKGNLYLETLEVYTYENVAKVNLFCIFLSNFC